MRSNFLCFSSTSSSIDRLCIRETTYCYTNLYCSWWCCDRFDNIPSNSNYPDVKCSTQRVNSCCVRYNQQKDYQVKYANHVIGMRFHHFPSNSYIVRENIRKRLDIYEKPILEFISFMSIILIYANSFANAVLVLMTNEKAKRFLRNFG